MNEEKLQYLIKTIESGAENSKSSLQITYGEVLESLGYENDFACFSADPFQVIIYAILKQAQKINGLETRIEELEKYTHTHPA